MVAAVGEGVTHVKAGDHVDGVHRLGRFCRAGVADAMRVSPMPPTMSRAGRPVCADLRHQPPRAEGRRQLQAGETLLIPFGASGGVGTSGSSWRRSPVQP